MTTYHKLIANFICCIDEPQPDYAASIMNNEDTPQVNVNAPLTLPADYLPTQLVYLCNSIAEAYNVPIEPVLMSALCIAGAAAGGYIESYIAGYKNRPSMWVMLIAPSSRGKSEPLKILAKPLEAIDSRLINEYSDRLKFWRAAEKTATKNAPNTMEKPKKTQVICAGKTDAARAEFICDNPRGGLYLKDELRGYIKTLNGKFSTIGVEQALEIADCAPLKITTKTDDEIKKADFSFMPVIGTIQNSILPTAISREFIDNGLLARFLPVIFAPRADSSPVGKLTKTGAPRELLDWWAKIIDALWALGASQIQFTLNVEGERAFEEEHAKYRAAYRADSTDSEHKRDFREGIWNKMLITIHKLILIAQLLDIVCYDRAAYENTQIGAAPVRWAFSCAPYLITNTMQTYDIICGAAQERQLTDRETIRHLAAMLLRKGKDVSQQAISELTGIDRANISRYLK